MISTTFWFPNQPQDLDPGQTNWVTLPMDFTTSHTDNTNSAKTSGPKLFQTWDPISRMGVFKCPGDPSYVSGLGPRVRSAIVASQAVGTLWVAVNSCNPRRQPNSPVTGQWLDRFH